MRKQQRPNYRNDSDGDRSGSLTLNFVEILLFWFSVVHSKDHFKKGLKIVFIYTFMSHFINFCETSYTTILIYKSTCTSFIHFN
jgi:hypothetical protein